MSYTYKVINNSLFFIEEESNKQYEVNVIPKGIGNNLFQVSIPDLSPRTLEANNAKELFNQVVDIDNVRRSFKRQTPEEFKSKFQKMKKKACPE
ncbi:hypothetical protein KXK87_004432 [Salmonella enterica]|uniref:hypothetical protein n=1 Tax=Enterobacterales TaxID=91347 RepID=UPI000C1E7D15|nr:MULTISPECIES: hypothetical protein [Enterobacterales]ECJ6944425.1 hypothetical protein [Salmonella enterica]EDH9727190.1 hypothetical protein [Salmonella enterica subsp. enterica serovar Alachua]EEA5699813.1 hypothetical protein [Salmonella enterica subsp. enterica serovar Enteritidis]EFB5549173.1 hypothetical protein [Escherichia coli]EHH0704543.1 hypothetical protein [Salmonella enterica subsp. enterica serovar Corvallis]EIS2705522.1 hypothetical protein [Shigella sonnei]EJR1198291.1 hy